MAMKILFFIFFLGIIISTFPQTKYLIFFKEKDITREHFLLKSNLTLNEAEKLISPRSINRRKKTMGEYLFLTYEDLPINENNILTLKALGVKIIHRLKWFNAVSAHLSDNQYFTVKELPFVKKIQPVKKLKSYLNLSETNSSSFKQNILFADSGFVYDYGPSFNQYMLSDIPPVHNIGITGEGVIIGMLDSGFRRTHEAFNNMDIIAEWDFVDSDSSTANEPGEDHGTFTLSLIGGFNEGNMVAPSFSSSYVLAKTENVVIESHIEEDNFAAALEWMDSIGVDITSSSIGYSVFDDSTYSYTYEDMDGQTTIVSQACNLAFERGIINITSAGNGGLSSWYYISAPADAFEIISVGAVTDQGENTWWHSRGPTYDGRLKPEVCAQGEGVGIGAEATGGFSISNGIWGTSGACPIAAGIVGMLLSKFPSLNNHQVRSIVLQSGDNLVSPDNVRGYGLLSAVKAVTFPNLSVANGVFQLNKIFMIEQGIVPTTVLLHYSIGNNPYFKEAMTFNGGHLFNFDFPIIFNPDTIRFYFTYSDSLGNSFREPEISFYKFYYGNLIIELDPTNFTAVDDRNFETVNKFVLFQNYPNPYNPSTKIKFTIPSVIASGTKQSQLVTLKVYDVLGNEILTLVNEELTAGEYEVEFNASHQVLTISEYIFTNLKQVNLFKQRKWFI